MGWGMENVTRLHSIQLIRRAALAVAVLSISACATVAPEAAAPTATIAKPAATADEQIVVMIGLDGLRADAIDRFPDAAPNLRAMASRGVRAAGMIPATPSVTFVNFYSIATGLYSGNTGIVSNASYSRRLGRVMARAEHSVADWWGGEPIWTTAEKQGVKTATMFWLGSEAENDGIRPTYWLPYDHEKPFDERTAEVLNWLALPEAARPRLATIYFHAVDSAAHVYGVGSPEERAAIAEVDRQVGALVAGVEALGMTARVNFIVVSDHGMTNVEAGKVINLDDFISFDDVMIPEFDGPDRSDRSELAHIFVRNGNIDGVYNALAQASLGRAFKVYRRENLPARWHLNNDDRTGDIVAVADEGWLLFGSSLTAAYEQRAVGGEHGYDRHLPSMQATFIADGPRFADGIVAEPFDNVEVYGMIAEILGIVPTETDGDLSRVRYLLTTADK